MASSLVALLGGFFFRATPEPLAWAGGSLVRRAFLRKERLEHEGRAVDPLTRAVAAAPRAFGITVAR